MLFIALSLIVMSFTLLAFIFLSSIFLSLTMKHAEHWEEGIEGIRCVAAPILDAYQRPVGAITVMSPTKRLPQSDLTKSVSGASTPQPAHVGSCCHETSRIVGQAF